MDISVSQQISTHKNYQRLYVTMISILCLIAGKIVAILHISGARVISYYFVFTKIMHQSDEKWILAQLGQYPPRKSSKCLWNQNIHPIQDEREKLWRFFIFLELEPFSYYFLITNTLNQSNDKYKLAQLNQYSSRENSKVPMGKQYKYSKKWNQRLW